MAAWHHNKYPPLAAMMFDLWRALTPAYQSYRWDPAKREWIDKYNEAAEPADEKATELK